MELKTGRLILREFRSSDFEDYLAYILDGHLREMLGLRNVFGRPSALENFNWLMENRKFIAVCKRKTTEQSGISVCTRRWMPLQEPSCFATNAVLPSPMRWQPGNSTMALCRKH